MSTKSKFGSHIMRFCTRGYSAIFKLIEGNSAVLRNSTSNYRNFLEIMNSFLMSLTESKSHFKARATAKRKQWIWRVMCHKWKTMQLVGNCQEISGRDPERWDDWFKCIYGSISKPQMPKHGKYGNSNGKYSSNMKVRGDGWGRSMFSAFWRTLFPCPTILNTSETCEWESFQCR